MRAIEMDGTKIAWQQSKEEPRNEKQKDSAKDDEEAPGWIDIGIGAAISLVATVADAIGGEENGEAASERTATKAHLGSSGGDLRFENGRWILGDENVQTKERIRAPPPVLQASTGKGVNFRARSGSRYVAMPLD